MNFLVISLTGQCPQRNVDGTLMMM